MFNLVSVLKFHVITVHVRVANEGGAHEPRCVSYLFPPLRGSNLGCLARGTGAEPSPWSLNV